MITFKQLMEILRNDVRIVDQGLYSAVKPNEESKHNLETFTQTHVGIGLPEDVHATVIYSTKAIDHDIASRYSKSEYVANVNGFAHWDGHDNTGYLVAKLDSDDLHQEHSRLVSHGCKPTYFNCPPN